MFYGVLGDTNGDDPEVIGEASWLMGQTCFPGEGLNGAKGHTGVDVLYIVFMTEFPEINSTTITDFNGLRNLGDEKIMTLLRSLNGSNSGGGVGGKQSSASLLYSSTLLFPYITALIIYGLGV